MAAICAAPCTLVRGSVATPLSSRQAFKPARAARSFAPRRAAGQRGAPQRRRATPAAAAAPPAEPAVRTSEERLEGGRVRLSVTIPVVVCQAGYKRVLDVYRKQANVQGYRKGKAPTDVLISHLGGQAAVNNSVLSELLGPAMAQALAPYQAEVIADSEAIEEGGEALGAAFDPAADFTFHVAWRTPYKELAVEAETPSSPAADAAAVEAKLRTLRKAGAALRIVADRGLQRGDVAVVDVAASDAASGAPLPGTSREGMRLDTGRRGRDFPPGHHEWAESLEAGIGGVAGLRRRLEQNQLVRQYVDRKWDELVELQRAVLGFEDILAKEELHPSAAEVEVVETLETQKVMQWLKENVKVTHKPYAG
eukprot:scaffold5.g772.t1